MSPESKQASAGDSLGLAGPLTTRPKIPPRFSPDFSEIESEALRHALQVAFVKLFWSDVKATPDRLYALLARALKDARISESQASAPLAASVDDGYLKFEERRAAIKRLADRYPE